jgi:nitronate monooxygenase
LRNAFLDRWRDSEDELREGDAALDGYEIAATRGDPAVVPIWAGEGIDLITELSSATDLVGILVEEAEAAMGELLGTKVRTSRSSKHAWIDDSEFGLHNST